MQALDFWKTVTVDRSGLLERFLGILDGLGIPYCVIGGHGVNAYADPVVSRDLYIAVAVSDFPRLRAALPPALQIREFPHSVKISEASFRLRIQIQTDSRYSSFVDRAEMHDVLDLQLPVAAIEDLMQGKVWAASDPQLPGSKRQKDLADIARLLEVRPDLRQQVPQAILGKLL